MNYLTKQIALFALFFLSFIPVIAQEQVMGHLIAAREYLKANKEQIAKLEIDSALMISPKHALANAMMGDLMSKRKKYLLALLSYDKAILANTNEAELFIKRAQLHIQLNNHRAYIIDDFNKAIALESTNTSYYIKKADYLANSVNPQTLKPDFYMAANTISEALSFNRKNDELLYLRCKYLYGDDQNLAALTDINKAISLNPHKDSYLAQRGYINFMIDNYRIAFTDYSRAININQQNPTYFEFRGHANYNMGRYVKAYDDYSIGIDLIINEIAVKEDKVSIDSPINKQLRGLLLFRGMSLVQDNKPFDGCDDFERAYQMGESKARNYMRKYCN